MELRSREPGGAERICRRGVFLLDFGWTRREWERRGSSEAGERGEEGFEFLGGS